MDHQVLGEELEDALREPVPLPAPLALLRGQLAPPARLTLMLELISLMWHGDAANSQIALYRRVANGLDDPEAAEIGLREVLDPEGPLEHSERLTRLDFSASPSADVQLPPGSVEKVRVYLIQGTVLIRNRSEEPLRVRGSILQKDYFLPLRSTDTIELGGWILEFADFLAFAQGSQQGSAADDYFLTLDNAELSIARSRTRESMARLRFGRFTELELLKDPEKVTLEGMEKQPEVGDTVTLPYHINLITKEGLAFSLDSLRRSGLQSGQRFALPSAHRKVLVSNEAGKLSGSDSLLLTPGLAGSFLLEIEFDAATGSGKIKVLSCARPIMVDGVSVSSGFVGNLENGALLRLSARQALRCRFSDNILDEERNLVRELHVEGVNFAFRRSGRTVDNLSFEVNRGQMLCIIGPSGSGKSTLLEILAGQRKPQKGAVRLNGLSLYDRRKRLAPLISFMPQEEALQANLSVREHLRHACSIRRPHLSRKVIARRVDFVLSELGLSPVGKRLVGNADSKNLSGGERSRLNAGLDLIGGGEIFLFDEPISGLSSKDAEHVITSLRQLARDKIVVTTLHRPSQRVLDNFDLVLLLDRGGRMAYFGPPRHLIDYFKAAQKDLRLPDPGTNGADFAFDILETPSLAGSKQTNGSSPQSTQADDRSRRRFTPEFWQERFENRRVMAQLSLTRATPATGLVTLPMAEDDLPAPEPPRHGWRQKLTILRTHFARSIRSRLRHSGSFYSIWLEAPILAVLVAMTLHASPEGSYEFNDALHLPVYLFLTVTVAMFFGLTNSATEISRDRPILRRERNYQIHPTYYLAAKFVTLMIVLTAQSVTFLGVSHRMLEIRGMLGTHLIWMILTGCCGSAIALMVSSMSRSERTALSSIPLILVPQILLAGALVPFSEMNRGLFINGSEARDRGAEPVPSAIIPLRYAYEGLTVAQATQNPFELRRREFQSQIEALKSKKNLTLEDREGLLKLKRLLTALYVQSAETGAEAKALLASEKDLLTPSDFSETAKPLEEFFVNERLQNQVSLAETLRLDQRQEKEKPTFLAEKKNFFGTMPSTGLYCGIALGTLSLSFLVFAHLFIRRFLNRA